MPLQVTSDSVNVTLEGGRFVSLPHLWLRDNCGCKDCRIEQTMEKRFLLHSVPLDLIPKSARYENDVLNLIWPDDHETAYAGEDIRALIGSQASSARLWGSEFRPKYVDYAAFINDDASAAVAIDDFLEHGAIILADMPTEPNTLEALSSRVGPMREMPFARIHEVKLDPTGYNVAHTALPLPPHNDFASMSWPPSIQALHMLANSCPGGESVIVDGWAVAEALRRDEPDMFDVLCKVPVTHRMFSDNIETLSSNPLIRTDSENRVCHLRFSNQLMQPMNPLQPRVVEFYRAFRELSRRLLHKDARAVFRLEAGHCLLVAGHRVLHAREAFEPSGERHLQDAYFEHECMRNHLTVIRRRLAQVKE